jgi:hypothetical protein
MNNNLAEFCRKCGASFPPRKGEGHCVEWEQCRLKTDERIEIMNPNDKRSPDDWLNHQHLRESHHGVKPMTKEQWRSGGSGTDRDGWVLVWIIVLFMVGAVVMGALGVLMGGPS